ncbi:MAG TPA: hypothetical protein VIA98_06040 [Allosphingosinicella sp.]|jgi:hypothetical protein
MYICDEIRQVDSLSVSSGGTQYCQKTGEFLADPTGHVRLYLVKGADGWGAYTRKHELPAEAFREFDDVGLAVQLRISNPNGYMTPYKNIVQIPSGMRASIEGDKVEFGRDDLREFLIDNWSPTDRWDDELLAWPGADASNTTMLLSGGMDSVAILLSHQLVGRPLRALHVARPGVEHELAFAQEVSRQYASGLDIAQFTSVTPDEAFTHLEFSPFGRSFNFPFYHRSMKSSLTTPFALHGELSLVDMQFYDHGQRFRHMRREVFHNPRWRSILHGARAVGGHLPEFGGDAKIGTILRSLRTARNKRLFLLGTVLGPKGFPGIARSPFIRDDSAFVEAINDRFTPFIDATDDPKHFDIDFFLMAYRFVEGTSNKNGPQEAAMSVGHQTHHPMNKLEALLRQVSITADAARDKTVLKKHFHERFPDMKSVVYFEKNCSLGSPDPHYVRDANWSEITEDAINMLPQSRFVAKDAYADYLRGRMWGEPHINIASLLKRRELALEQTRAAAPLAGASAG